MSVLQLSRIYIYPVKSLRGISLTNTRLTAKGPQWDRRWMLVDRDGNFLSQRSLPAMSRLQPAIEGDSLRITDLRGNRADLLLPLQIRTGATEKEVTVWQDRCKALEVSEMADDWFSAALDRPCQLVFMPEESHRPVEPKYAKEEESVSFADAYPYLIIGAASLEDLNERLSEPIDMLRFRPNLVFSGGTPFMEDAWRGFTIGSARFRGTKPCARCQVPTIDLETGKTSKEPTRTLATFRRQGNKILFGMNACWELDNENAGHFIQVGDPVRVEK